MGQIQPADTKARRKALWVVGIATLYGLCAILAFEYYQHDFETWLERNIDYLVRNSFVVFLAALVFVSPVFAAGIYLFLLGNRTVRAQRFPPPHYAVSRDTPVLEGSQGIRRGRIIQFLSILILLAAGATPFILLSIFRALGNAA
jgi:hypothetical protein